ncbi:hypothetical protein ACTXT7_001884 [Hymenolepis weldensis]
MVDNVKPVGTAMILAMKAVSASTLRVQGQVSKDPTFDSMGFLRHYMSWCGYAFSPGSVIFGPWFSFDQYLQANKLTGPSFNSLFRDLFQSTVSCFIACACIIYSTYLSSIIQASYFLSFRWTNAYAQSQSFRFSHYFVGFFSQAMHQAIGFAAVTNPKSLITPLFLIVFIDDTLGDLQIIPTILDYCFGDKSDLSGIASVSGGCGGSLELPYAHLAQAMRFGQLPALLLTYAFSSLLHYFEKNLRGGWMLAFALDHVCRNAIIKIRFPLCFLRSYLQSAYLAVMFDTSEQQDKGYNMFHVLKKWSNLNFLSHIVAALTCLLSLLI